MAAEGFSYIKHVVSRENILTERIRKLQQEIRRQPVYGDWERDHLLTEYWRQSEGEHIYIRRAKAFHKILTEKTIRIFDGELIVGAPTKYLSGGAFYPEFSHDWIEEEWEKFTSREADRFCPVGDKGMVLSDIQFWKGKSLADEALCLWYEKSPTSIQDIFDSRVTAGDRPATHGRQIIDFVKVLDAGLRGIIEETKEMKDKATLSSTQDIHKHYFRNSCIIACEAVIKFAKRHAELAREMAKSEASERRKEELEGIAETCERVPEHPAKTFYEALQSLWLTHVCIEIENNSFGYSLGRMDQYLYPYYKRDIEQGRITRDRAAELLSCLWLKFSTIHWLTRWSIVALTQTSNFQNVTIGGRDRDGKDASNELSHIMVEVDTALKLPQPTLSLRYHDCISEEFLFKCGEDIGTGGGKPAIFCENYAYSVLPLYGVPLGDVVEFAPIGCVEMGIPGKTALFAGCFVSLPHCLELVFTKGIHRKTGKKIGIEIGDVETFSTFDEFMNAFLRQFEFIHHAIVTYSNIAQVAIRPYLTPCPFNSALISDCIDTGKDIHSGGAMYNQFFASYPFGMVTTANSLYAVKKLVYEDKQIAMRELKNALSANFEGDGYRHIRRLCLNLPKYGNDRDEVDTIQRELFKTISGIVMQQKNVFGHPKAPAYLGITAHYWHGSGCGATPDGRLAYTPFADGSLSAYPGTDTQGPTALIKSAAKANPSPALATLFNMKLNSSAMRGAGDMRNLWSLVKTYSDLGGYHIQFNVIDRETLLDAKKHPERYRNLLVRVAGFSAYFVDLAPAVQDDIIARTEHGFE
jgi:pyruvate formate-lyase/glycerol dehydratase family glycyl radical enzyme